MISIFNLLFSQKIITKYDDKYGVVAFDRVYENNLNYNSYYGVIMLGVDVNKIEDFLIPPILDHVRIDKINNVYVINFEIDKKWYWDISLSNVKSELYKILGTDVLNYFYYIQFENQFENTDPIWASYWKGIVDNNKDLFAAKGEFEKTISYDTRMQLQKDLRKSSYIEFREKRDELQASLKAQKEELKREQIKESLKRVDLKIRKISNYNADNETYKITIASINEDIQEMEVIINVPLDAAPDFKIHFEEVEIKGDQFLDDNLIDKKVVNLIAKFKNNQYEIGERQDLPKYITSTTISASKPKIISIPKLNAKIQFNDSNENNILDGGEQSNIKLTVRNEGEGSAQGVNIKLQVDDVSALKFTPDKYIGNIEAKSEKSVIIPINALESITSGNRNFKMMITESNGFNPAPIELEISTKELVKPTLKLSEVAVENNISKLPILKQSETSKIIFRVENNSKADAFNLVFNYQIPNNVLLLNGDIKIEVPQLKAGSILDIPIDVAPNNRSNSSEEFKLSYSGKYLNGTLSKILPIESINAVTNKVVISGKEETNASYSESIAADLNIDIENNIPINKNVNINAIGVVLGIEKYKNAGNVTFASRDAYLVKEYFNKCLGIPLENIYFKLNGDVTKGEMEKIFGGWLQNRVNENTSVYVYYAGHGAPSGEQDAYLIPNDGDPNYAEINGYSLNKMYNQLGNLPSNMITVFLDACFSGQDREQKMLIKDARGLGIKTKASQIPDNLNVFSASSNDQVSSGWPEKKHGLFTYFMLKGMQGSADQNNDKEVSYEELSNYIKLNVERQAGFLDRKQNPQSKLVDFKSKINLYIP